MNPLRKTLSLLQLVIHIEGKTAMLNLACYPAVLHRHSREMINKLERAGLGYYVQSVNTKQKLGMIFNSMMTIVISYLFIL